jgi:hypothetical protein
VTLDAPVAVPETVAWIATGTIGGRLRWDTLFVPLVAPGWYGRGRRWRRGSAAR